MYIELYLFIWQCPWIWIEFCVFLLPTYMAWYLMRKATATCHTIVCEALVIAQAWRFALQSVSSLDSQSVSQSACWESVSHNKRKLSLIWQAVNPAAACNLHREGWQKGLACNNASSKTHIGTTYTNAVVANSPPWCGVLFQVLVCR